MHNIRTLKNPTSVPAENKKPNILRRRTAFRPASPIGEISGGKSLLTLENLKNANSNATQSRTDEGASDNNGKETKTNTRTRRHVQRIILDSYVCNKLKNSHENNLPKSDDTNIIVIPSSTVTNDEQNVPVMEYGLDATEGLMVALESGILEESQLEIGEGSEQKHFWLCPIVDCGKLYSNKPDLHVHILSHCDLNEFKCNMEGCSQEFISENQLKQHHDEVHNPSNTVISVEELCKQVEKSNEGGREILDGALASVGFKEDQIHSIKLPNGGRHWICPYSNCELTFKTQYLLKNHIVMHYDIKPFKCSHEGCGWAFRSLYTLKCHSSVHSVRGSSQHPCTYPGCHKTFSTKYNLTAHKRRHEKSHDQRNACPARGCTLTFPQRSLLEVHISNDHTLQQAPHGCASCAKRFWWTTGMQAHARVHAQSPGEPICSWPGCGRRFTQPCRLRYHLRSHTGDKPYCCTFASCKSAFSSSGKLKRHARAHNGDRRYVCDICKRAFRRPEHLREHLPRHSPHRNLQCDYPDCHQLFSNKSSIYTHKKRDHGINTKIKLDNLLEDDLSSLNNSTDTIEMKVCDDMLSSRSARTHVPWASDNSCEPQRSPILEESGLLQHQSSCGNPLVCGGLGLEGENSVVSAGLSLECEEAEVGSLPELESDLLCPSSDHINSLLLQEELSDGMLYTTEDEAALHILLSEDP